MYRHRLLLALVLIVLGCASPSTGGRSGDPASGRPATPATRVIAAVRSAPASLAQNRLFTPGASGSVPGGDALEELVSAGLTQWNSDSVLIPQLADAVPSIENGRWKTFPDGRMQTTWTIKPGVRWHDGTPLTTADLLFTARVDQDPDAGIPRNATYDLIEAIDAVDASTITVSWKRPFIEADAMFGYAMALPMPRHLLEETYLTDKPNLFGIPYWTQDFVGLGPYRVQQWAADSHLILRANRDYVLGRPIVDEIEVRFVPDPNTLMANVLAEIELTLGRALSFDQAMQIRDQWRDGRVIARPNASVPVIPQFIGPSPEVVGELRFRRALSHAIDREQLVESLMAGQTEIADSFVSPGDPAYPAVQARAVSYRYDPRATSELIEGLGFVRAADGFRGASGERLAVQIQTAAQNDRNLKVTSAVAGFWEQAGVSVEQAIIPIQRFQDVAYRAQFPAFQITATSGGTTARDVRRYHSSATPLPENQFRSAGNSSRYRSPELDALIDRYLTTIGSTDRYAVLADLVHHQTENVTIMPLFYDVTVTMAANRLRNISGRSERATEGWNAQAWDVDR